MTPFVTLNLTCNRVNQHRSLVHQHDCVQSLADASFLQATSRLVNNNRSVAQRRTSPTVVGRRILDNNGRKLAALGDIKQSSLNSRPLGDGGLSAMLGREEAASALIGTVRLILVAVICVLLFKLRSPKLAGSDGKRRAPRATTQISAADQQEADRLGKQSGAAQQLRRHSEPSIANGTGVDGLISSSNCIASGKARSRRHSDTPSLASLQLPPGPTGLPFLGYLPFLGNEIHLTLTDLSRRFGPIYQIFLGGIRVVVLNDASLVRHAFKQTVFSGRPDTQLTRILQGYGIVNSEGALWKEQRAFLHSALRKLGAKSLMSGANGLEAKIQVSNSLFVCLFVLGATQQDKLGFASRVRPRCEARLVLPCC